MPRDPHSIREEPLYQPSTRPTADPSVWEEPALLPNLAPADPSRTPAAELQRHWRDASPAAAWALTFALALAAGPFAIICALLKSAAASAILAIVVVAPMVEELAKAALPLIVIERAPYRFTSTTQITVACAAAGLAFAAIENALYLLVYIRDPSPGLILWRWTVCVLLHTVCAILASRGLCRLWRTARATLTRPNPAFAKPHIIAAAITHGIYNAAVLLFSASSAAP